MSTPDIPEPRDVADAPGTPVGPSPRRRLGRLRRATWATWATSAAALVAAGAVGILVTGRLTAPDPTDVCIEAPADADTRTATKADRLPPEQRTADGVGVEPAEPAEPQILPADCMPSDAPTAPVPEPAPAAPGDAAPGDAAPGDAAWVGAAGPDTTGVPAGVSLTEGASGTFDEDGLVIDGQLIVGDLTLTGDDQVLRNSRVEGHVIVRGSRTVVEDVEIGALSVSGATSFTGRRMEVFGAPGEDGIHITSGGDTRAADVLIEDSWVHSPEVDAASHYDGVQVRGVDGLTLRGNTIDLGSWRRQYNAAIFLEDANGGNVDVVVEQNTINGGGYTLYVGGRDVSVVDNRFGRDARWGLLYPQGDDFAASGNTWADTGAVVTLP